MDIKAYAVRKDDIKGDIVCESNVGILESARYLGEYRFTGDFPFDNHALHFAFRP